MIKGFEGFSSLTGFERRSFKRFGFPGLFEANQNSEVIRGIKSAGLMLRIDFREQGSLYDVEDIGR